MASNNILEYKCPNCDAPMIFGGATQQMTCEYCDSTFDIEDIKAYNSSILTSTEEVFEWEDGTLAEFNSEDGNAMQLFVCPACSGQLLTDANTTATFCPFCENPAVLPQRLTGGLKPDGVIPFKKTKKDAQEAFLALCKTKKLLPRVFTDKQRIEKITGIYAPFWLYDCSGKERARYQATRITTWTDSRFNYTKTDQYLLIRNGEADFEAVPLDGSSKLENATMESIEPYDASEVVPFEPAYLSGYFADKYDVKEEDGHERIRQRVEASLDAELLNTCVGFNTVNKTSGNTTVNHGKAKYVLLPVWFLTTKYQGETYTFAMNGQTGKMTGTFPVDKAMTRKYFGKVCAAVAAVAAILQFIFM